MSAGDGEEASWASLGNSAATEPVSALSRLFPRAHNKVLEERSWEQMGRRADSTIPIWDTTWRIAEVETPVHVPPQIQWANKVSAGKWPWEAGYDPTAALGGSIMPSTTHYTDSLVELGMKWSSAKGDGGASSIRRAYARGKNTGKPRVNLRIDRSTPHHQYGCCSARRRTPCNSVARWCTTEALLSHR